MTESQRQVLIAESEHRLFRWKEDYKTANAEVNRVTEHLRILILTSKNYQNKVEEEEALIKTLNQSSDK